MQFSQNQATSGLFSDILKHFEGDLNVPPRIMAVIAEYIEEAILSGSERELSSMSADLLTLVRAVVSRAPKEALNAALDANNAPTSEKAAHLLGQLGFAQMLATQASSRRTEHQHVELASSARLLPLMQALFESELRNVDLANQLQLKPETVSRSLCVLRESGLSDFQKRGRDAFNFLTPSGIETFNIIRETVAFTNAKGEEDQKSTDSDRKSLFDFSAVRSAVQTLPAPLRARQTLAPVSKDEVEYA